MSSRTADELLLIHGEESFLVDREAAAWLAAAREACVSDLNVEILDSPGKLDQLRRSVAEVPFLDARRYVLVRDPPQLSERTRRGAEDADAFAAVLEQRSPTTSLCLVLHGRVTPANPVLRSVERLGGRVVAFAQLRGRELRDWVDRRLRERGLNLDRPARDRLLGVVGSDLGRLDSEMDKLIAYGDGRARLSEAEVGRVLSGDEPVEVWDVVERLMTPPHGPGAGAVDALLAEGVSPQHLIAVLAGRFREILIASDLLGSRGGGADLVARELGLPTWRAERVVRWARAVNADTVEGWLRRLQEIDASVKLGEASDVEGLRALALQAAADVAGKR